MKIEKVNDHQIRCTLTKADLADRELKISELAYGTEKAKSLFRDMMQQASYEFGFDADDIPLMIEAIPLNSDCIVLVITKVEDPEELDTRFSKFAPSVHDEEDEEQEIGNTLDSMLQSLSEGADDVLDLFKKIHESHLSETIAGSADTLGNIGLVLLGCHPGPQDGFGAEIPRLHGPGLGRRIVHQFPGDLLYKPTHGIVLVFPPDHTAASTGQSQFLLGPGDAHIGQPALLLQIPGIV